MFELVSYESLNARQKENYNFQKVAARLADYGFNCLRLSDDWHGADFIACHINGETFLKVQLKGRLTVDKKYVGKDIHIAFMEGDECFVYPHDKVLRELMDQGRMREETRRWSEEGNRSWRKPPSWAFAILEEFRV